MRWPLKASALALALAVTAVACGGGSDDAAPTTSTTAEQAPSDGPPDPRLLDEDEAEADEAEALDLPLTLMPGIVDEVVPIDPGYNTGGPTGGGQISGVAMPTQFECTPDGTLLVSPIRVYPANGGTEQVTWGLAVERWDGYAWQSWSATRLDTTFAGPTGLQRTAWSVSQTTAPAVRTGPLGGGYPIVQIDVGSSGDYRIVSMVNTTTSGNIQAGFLAGGDFCTV